jgi:serine protease Do
MMHIRFFRPVMAVVSIFMLLATTALRAGELPDFTELVQASSASVVNISTTKKVQGQPWGEGLDIPDLPEDSPLNEFLERFFGRDGMPEYDSRSLGSGFVLSDDGYILTNNHVVSEADEVIVRLSDRRELIAEVVGTDQQSDVALLRVEADNLPAVKLGNSRDLKVGEWVLAIGSPFGFDHTVTAGIVSAKGRSLPGENYVPFIQTDVAINPGNSGGPLFNLDGEVIGVNSQIYSRSGGFMGLSFAIPIEMAIDVAEQLKTKGRVSRGWLGVLIQEVTRDLADSFEMNKPAGALVARVLPNSPAEKAGIEVGDVILSFNGREVPESTALPPMVGRTSVGTEAPVEVLRDGKKKTLEVHIGELPEEDQLAALPQGPKTPKADRRLNLAVGALTAELRDQLDIDHGVVVEEIGPGPAFDAGIREGDVIASINRQKIEGPSDFKELVAELEPGSTVAVYVHRPAGPLYLALRMPKNRR